jgi:hypothetical protein
MMRRAAKAASQYMNAEHSILHGMHSRIGPRRWSGGTAILLALPTKLGRSYKIEGGGCIRACKVLASNLTKMFHVKHFGKAAAAGSVRPFVDFPAEN